MRNLNTNLRAALCGLLLAGALGGGVATPTIATAEPARETHLFDIKPQPLVSALLEFSKQANRQVVGATQALREIQTPGVSGDLSVGDALGKLLEGTGLQYQLVGEHSVRIVSAGSSAASVSSSSAGAKGQEEGMRLAQSAQTETQQDQGKVEDQLKKIDEPPATAKQQDQDIKEVVVTAQKREERLQDVPISMSVVTGEELDRSRDQGILDALKNTPGVNISEGGGVMDREVRIRGVGSTGYMSGATPVGFYFDGSPFGAVMTPLHPDVNVYDLDRLEVLRGPQGTLYGASAQAGVVRILTKDADLDNFEWKARANYSHTQYGGGNVRADTAVNIPIVEGKLAARAVLGYQDLSGWIDKPTRADANDVSVRNIRLKLNAQLTDALKVGLSAWISRTEAGAWDLSSAGTETQSLTADVDANGSEFDMYALKVSYDASRFSLTSTTTYFDSYMYLGLGQGVPTTFTVDASETPQIFTQEFNLASTQEGPWRWTAGAMYRDVEEEALIGVPPLVLFPRLNTHTSQSWAIFGELTRKFLDGKLEFTAGLRHFQDEVGVQERLRLGNVQPVEYIDRDSTFDSTTPRLILTWKPDRQMTVYASYAEGFRSGFQQLPNNLAVLPDLPDVEPDKLVNYELGAKGALFDGLMQYDVAAYYMDWKDVQLTLLTQFAGGSYLFIVNGARAAGAGIDAGLTVNPVEGLQLGVTFGWNDLQVSQDVYFGDTVLYRQGDRINLSSPWNISASASYDFPLGESGLQGSFAAGANLTSELDYLGLIANERSIIGIGDALLIGRVSFGVSSPRWQATLFVDNVNNEQDSPNMNVLTNSHRDTRIRPRTVGVQFEYKM